MTEEKKLYGYAGQILRINLTDSTTDIVPTSRYVPEYIGGRAVCNKIFWDEVGPGVGAFDPENKMIFMTGPTTGTGIPTGGRAVMTSISPNSLPEQYSYGSIGGWIGTVLKYAGYDGFILEGKAPKHTYILIEDDKVQFLDAETIWGMTVHNTQQSLLRIHGQGIHSMVIGPAGEHLHRNASITTSNDNAFAKAGFGAVWGSKNLKAIAIRGSGAVYPADIDKILDLRMKVGRPDMVPNPILRKMSIGHVSNNFPQEWENGAYACSPGCNARCQRLVMNTKSAFTGERINQTEKCVSILAYNFTYEHPWGAPLFVLSPKNSRTLGQQKSYPKPLDPTDPDLAMVSEQYKGDRMDLWGPSFDRGNLMMHLCNEYGIDKWDVCIWYFTWLSMAKKEGLLDDLDFGMEVDVENPTFVKHFIDSMTYRIGIGDIFAEGMARAIRILGKEKYGDTIYHGRYNQGGVRLDIPVSLETGWGHCAHWQGRGFQSTPKWLWVANALIMMVNTRDPFGAGHVHLTPAELKKFKDNPSNSPELIEHVIFTEIASMIKDTVTSCEWQSPDIIWHDMELELYKAATGNEAYTLEDIRNIGYRSKLLYRAILMRNFGRCRDMEVEEVYPFLTYPDPWGEVDTWDEWNDTVDLYYRMNGWDLETGWPYRSTWEKYELGDVADEMERLGMLPPEGRTEYVRKPNPIGR